MPEPAPSPADLRAPLARALYAQDHGAEAAPAWDDEGLDADRPGLRARYLDRADALIAGPLAGLVADAAGQARVRAEQDEELRVLRRQRMGPERERELLEANGRLIERARAAEAARTAAEAERAGLQRERDVAREAEGFWQQFAFDADDLATRRLVRAVEERTCAERSAILERTQRERMERVLRLFADRADVMPKEGWVSDLVQANRDLPLWWFHAARIARDHAEPVMTGEEGQAEG